VVSGRFKRRIVIAAIGLGVVGLGGTALATSSSGGNTFLDDVARHLGVAPAKLQTAVNQAFADRLNQLVKEGKLTRKQADAILKRFKEHGGVPFASPFGGPHQFRHDGFGGQHMPFGHRMPFMAPGPRPMFGGVAGYLGLSQKALLAGLRSGKTLAAIAKAQGKSVSGLEKVMLAPVRKQLDSAVASGRLTKTQASRWLKGLSEHIDRIVTQGFGFRHDGPWHHGPGDGDSGAKPHQPTAFSL